MRFLLIDATKKTVGVGDCRNLSVAQTELGLSHVDHGTIDRGIGYVVYEFGFFVPKEQQKYFAIGNLLIAGNAVLFAYDEAGETVDFPHVGPPIFFFENPEQVERAIKRGYVLRPQMAVNGEVFWQWPDPPRDSNIIKEMESHGHRRQP